MMYPTRLSIFVGAMFLVLSFGLEINGAENDDGTMAVAVSESDKQPILSLESDEEISRVTIKRKKKYYIGDKIDPFIPLLPDSSIRHSPEKKEVVSSKRLLTPLEKMELGQIKLVAIVTSQRGRLAMVEEANGKGYEVRVGTYIGKNGGKISDISPDRIFVKEYVKDYKGNAIERIQEIKLRKRDGGE